MNVAEQTPITALLHPKLVVVTLAAAMLLPTRTTSEVIRLSPFVSRMTLPDRGGVTYVHGSGEVVETAVLSARQFDEGTVDNAAMRIRSLTNLPIAVLGIAAGVTRQAYYDWLENKRIGTDRARRLEQLERTFESLVALIGDGETLKAWLQHESELGPPLQLLRSGRDDVVIGLTSVRRSTRVETPRGRIAQTARRRPVNQARREAAYRQYSITVTEDHSDPSDVIEAGETLGYIRVE